MYILSRVGFIHINIHILYIYVKLIILNTCLFMLYFFRAGSMFCRISLTLSGMLSVTKYIVFRAVSGKNPFSPNRASTVGSNPLPSIPICKGDKNFTGTILTHWKVTSITTCFKIVQIIYLHHVNVIAKCLKSHFKHDFFGQVTGTLKDHVAFHRSDLVIARELGGVHDRTNLITLQGITNLLPQPSWNKDKISYLSQWQWSNWKFCSPSRWKDRFK